MLEALWNHRDSLARQRDVAPEKVIPAKVLATLALHKPRSRQDVLTSPLFQRRARRRDAAGYWEAIAPVWAIPIPDLPERRFVEHKDPYPPVKHWERSHSDAADRWTLVRTAVLSTADDIGIRQDVLLKPAVQKLLAWEGWDSPEHIADKLRSYGACEWQIDVAGSSIQAAARRAGI